MVKFSGTGPNGLAAGEVLPPIEASGGSLVVPDAELLFTADYTRVGDDLVLTGADGATLVIVNYFALDAAPILFSPDGAMMAPQLIATLVASQTPRLFAQTGDIDTDPPIGQIQDVVGTAAIIRDGVPVELQIGDPVFQNDVVQTGLASELAIGFADGTIFTLSANARITLDGMIYDPAGADNSLVLSIVQGTFSFITGQVAPSGEMLIKTPVGTIGIRGTEGYGTLESALGPLTFTASATGGGPPIGLTYRDPLTGETIANITTDGDAYIITRLGAPVGVRPATAQELNAFANQSDKNFDTQTNIQLDNVPDGPINQEAPDPNQRDDTGEDGDAPLETEAGPGSGAAQSSGSGFEPANELAESGPDTEDTGTTDDTTIETTSPPETNTEPPVEPPVDPPIDPPSVVNQAPVASADAATTDENTAVVIAVLANDTDPDGNALSVSPLTQGANGTVVANPDGTLTYTPNSGFSGADSFTYTVADGLGGFDTATVSVTVVDVDLDQVVTGTDGPDIVNTGAGNDIIATLGGDDAIVSGGGNDVIVPGADNDTVNAGAGNDAILYTVGDGSDTIAGGPGNDTLLISGAASPNDVAITVTGQTGSTGSPNLTISVGNDNLSVSGIEEIVIQGGGGNDTVIIVGDLVGVSQNTVIVDGGAGADVVDASDMTSDQRLVLLGGAGDDTLTGGAGAEDIAVFQGNFADYSFQNLDDGAIQVSDSQDGRDGIDSLRSIDILRFADGDVLAGDLNQAPSDFDIAATATFENLAATGLSFADGVIPGEAAEFDNTPGADLPLSDDDTETVALSFNFNFQGVDYSDITVSSNGFIWLGGTSFGSDCCDADDAEFLSDPPRIAPAWYDLDPGDGGTVSFVDLGDRAIVTWRDVPEFSNDDGNTFQAVLFADGRIALNYLTLNADTSNGHLHDAIVGITAGGGASDPGESDLSVPGAADTGAEGTVYEFFERENTAGADNFDLSGQSILFTPNGSGGWNVTTATAGQGIGDEGAFDAGFLFEFQVGEAGIVADNIHGTDPEDGVTTQFTITDLPRNAAGEIAGQLLIDRGGDGTIDAILGGASLGTAAANVQSGDSVFYFLSDADFQTTPGAATFTYLTVDSGGLTSDGATATVTFGNAPPRADSATLVFDEDSQDNPLNLTAPLDPDGDNLTIRIETLPTLGNVTFAGGGIGLETGTPISVAQLLGLEYDAPADANGPAGQLVYSVSDGTVTVNGTVDFDITPVNDPPVAQDDAFTTDEDTALITGNVLDDNGNGADGDPEGDPLTVSAVNGNAVFVGVQVTLASGALLTLNTNGTFSYDPNGQFENLGPNDSGSDSFTYTIADGNGGEDTATATVTIAGVNDAPVVDLNGAGAGIDFAASFIGGQGPVSIAAPDAAVFDVDSPFLDSLRVTLTNRPDGTAEVLNADAGNTGVQVLFNSATGVLTLAGGTPADYQTILRTLTYENTSANPTTGLRTISVQADDNGDVNSLSDVAEITLEVFAGNAAPAVDLNSGDAGGINEISSFTEGDAPVSIAPSAEVDDADGGTLVSLTLTITNLQDAGAEFLSANTAGTTVTAVFNDVTGVLSLTGGASLAEYQQVLRTVTYENQSEDPSEGDRTIEVVADDGQDTSQIAVATVTVSPINDAPVVDLNGAGTGINVALDFTEGDNPVFIAPQGIVLDIDSGNLVSLTVRITNVQDLLAEQLTGTNFGNISSTVFADGRIVFTGPASTTAFEASLRSVTYVNNSDDPTEGDRTIEIIADDGQATSQIAVATVTVSPVNDAPLAVDDNADTNEDSPVDIVVLANDSDAEGDTLSVTEVDGNAVTVGQAVALGSGALVTLNAAGTFTYDPNGQFETLPFDDSDNDSFTYTIADGNGGASTATVSIDILGQNDAPVAQDDAFAVGQGQTLSVNALNGVLLNDDDVDGDNLTVDTAPLTDVANGVLSLNLDGSFTYTPNANFNGADSFTYQISDGEGGFDSAAVTITVQQPANQQTWTNFTDDGFWDTADNWSQGRVPADGDDVTIPAGLGDAIYRTDSGTTNLNSLAVDGGLIINNGVLNVANASTFSTSSGLSLRGGEFGGAGDVTINGVADWIAGTLSGARTFTVNGTIDVSGVTPHVLTDTAFVISNQGSATFSVNSLTGDGSVANEGTLLVQGAVSLDGAFANEFGGTLRIEGTGTSGSGVLTLANGFTNAGEIELIDIFGNRFADIRVDSGVLINTGTISVLEGAAGGRSILTAAIDNQGSVVVEIDTTVTLGAGQFFDTQSGDVQIGTGDVLRIVGGGFRVGLGTGLTGTGEIQMDSGAVLDVVGDTGLAAGGPSLVLSTAEIALGAATTFTNETSVSMTSSTLTGAGQFLNQGTLTMTSVTGDGSVANEGTLLVQGAVSLDGAFANEFGGTLRIEGTGTSGSGVLTLANGFTNAGEIELIDIFGNRFADIRVDSGVLINTGTISVLEGAAGGRSILTAAIDNQGSVVVEIDTTVVNGASEALNNSGTLDIAAGQTLTVSGGALNNLDTGVIQGNGTLDVSTSTFTNGGELNPGTSAGAFAILGDYTQESTGSLNIELGDANDGDFDVLTISGTATLGGTLNITLLPGFDASEGLTFDIITAGTFVGGFDAVNIPNLTGVEITLDNDVTDGIFTLTIAGTVAPPFSGDVQEAGVTETLDLDPRATYLRTNDSQSLDATAFSLAARGIVPGDIVVLEPLGDYSVDSSSGDIFDETVGVFSGSATLLASDQLNRVQDAIEVGEDVVTNPTFFGNDATDIPEDFDLDETLGRVPVGASHVFFSTTNTAFQNNSDPDGDYAVRINKPLVVGVTGAGAFTLGAGESFTETNMILGFDATSSAIGSVTGPGASLTLDGLVIGLRGSADFILGGGAVLTAGFVGLGLDQGGLGSLAVTGAGTQLNVTAGTELIVGESGTGTLDIVDGAAVTVGTPGSNAEIIIGDQASGVGTVTVNNASLTLNGAPGLTGLSVGSEGDGTLNIEQVGTVTVNASFNVIGAESGARGEVLVEQGGVFAVNGFLSIGGAFNQAGNPNLPDAFGLLDIDGGTVTTQGLAAGFANGEGRVVVDRGGSLTDLSLVTIGGRGLGSLIVGGTVATQTLEIGLDPTGNGTVSVEAGGNLSNTFFMTVGEAGEGILNISGTVETNSLTIGRNSTGNGTVSVEAGGSLTSATSIIIGNQGQGTLNISGTVTSQFLLAGDLAGSNGGVVVDRGGSFTTTNNAFLGNVGSGTLELIHGGTADLDGLFVGGLGGGAGSLLVSGTSRLDVGTGGFNIGGANAGPGQVTIQNGGHIEKFDGFSIGANATVNAGKGSLGLGSSGALSLNSGGTLNLGEGPGTFEIDGGYTQNTGGILNLTLGAGGASVVVRDTADFTTAPRVNLIRDTENAPRFGDAFTLSAASVLGLTAQNFALTGFSLDQGGNLASTGGGNFQFTVRTPDTVVTNFEGTQFSINVSGVKEIYTDFVDTVAQNGIFRVASAANEESFAVFARDVTAGLIQVSGVGDSRAVFNAATNSAADLIVDQSGARTSTATVGSSGSLNVANSATVGFLGAGFAELFVHGDMSTTNLLIGDRVNSNGKVTVAGGILNVTGTNSFALIVGDEGAGELIVSNGGVIDDESGLLIANAAGSSGTVTVTGDGSQLNVTNNAFIANGFFNPSGFGIPGAASSGALNVLDGGVARFTQLFIGTRDNATGTVIVDGEGSRLTAESDQNVFLQVVVGTNFESTGVGGVGEVTVSNGGFLGAPNVNVGQSAAGGTVTVTGDGSQMIAADFLAVATVADATGTLNILDGGSVSFGGNFGIGTALGAVGTVSVDGIGSSLTTTNSPSDTSSNFLGVGANFGNPGGTGTLNITNGGSVRTKSVRIGDGPDSTGTVLVDGAGSRLATFGFTPNSDENTIRIGSRSDTADGTLTISNGGFLSTGNLSVSGTGIARLVVTGPGSVVRASNDDGLVFGETGAGGFLRAGGRNNGSGEIEVKNGGQIFIAGSAETIEAGLQIARNDGDTGRVLIDGAGAAPGTTFIDISGPQPFFNLRTGAGTLDIINGGELRMSGGGGIAQIGRGNAELTNPQPSDGNIPVQAALSTATVNSGGKLIVASGAAPRAAEIIIGQETNGNGRLIVDGTNDVADTRSEILLSAGAAGQQAAFFSVGLRGTGALSILGGARVLIDGEAGDFPGMSIGGSTFGGGDGTGTVLVDGSGSTLEMTGDQTPFFAVGNSGTGALTVSNGGQVIINTNSPTNVADFDIGFGAQGNGTAIVTGAGSAVTLQGSAGVNGGSVDIGRLGQGSLSILDGGTVSNGPNGITTIGREVGSSGTVLIQGTGIANVSTLNAGAFLLVGMDFDFGTELPLGPNTGGTGTLTIGAFGQVNADQVFIGTDGTLAGTGDLNATTTTLDGGVIAAGASAGTLNIDGDLVFNEGVLDIELGGTAMGQSDLIDISGAVTIFGGLLDFSFIGGYTPLTGDTITVLNSAGGLVADAGNTSIVVRGLGSDFAFDLDFGANEIVFTAQVDVLAGGGALFVGSGRIDTFFGGDGIDKLSGAGGNDFFDGGAGNDLLIGGADNDILTGGIGDDDIIGGAGTDTAVFSDSIIEYEILENAGVITVRDLNPSSDPTDADLGTDTLTDVEILVFDDFTGTFAEFNAAIFGTLDDDPALTGTAGNDLIFGLAGSDLLNGLAGADDLRGGADDDTLIGGDGNDTLDGGFGNDSLVGGADNDTLTGGFGSDTLFGQAGDDTLGGGVGDDTLTGGTGADDLTGGSGADTFVFSPGNGGATIDLADVITDFEDGVDTIGLADGLTFAQLTLTDNGADTQISVTGTPEILVVVDGIIQSQLDENDFTVIAGP